jgi:hypothetical protein
VSDEDWGRVQAEKEQKRLDIAQLEAQLAQRRLELLQAEAKERSFARRDLAVLKELDLAKEQAEGNTAPSTSLSAVEPSISEPFADSGWSQADDFLDPSLLDFSSFLENSSFACPDAAGGNSVPVSCSS